EGDRRGPLRGPREQRAPHSRERRRRQVIMSSKPARPARIVSFGEIMLRLSPPGFERLLQSPVLSATFGGGEANVAVSLAHFGLESAYVTRVPKNAIGDAA